MAKSNAAKKTKPLDPYSSDRFEDGVCTACGHDFDKHMGPGATTAGPFTCPPLPPEKKQVTVDEAVIAKGGKPGNLKEQLDASGIFGDQTKAAANFAQTAPADEQARELIDVKAIQPMKRNPRGDLGDLTELKKSLEASGLIVPILVRVLEDGKRYEVVSGHRRHAAAKALGWDSILCDVRVMSELQALELNLTEQLQRAELSPLQEAAACKDLQELSGYDAKQIGAKLGQSESWALKRLALHKVDAGVKKALEADAISLTVALAIAALPTRELQLDALSRVKTPEWQRPRPASAQIDDIQRLVCRPLKSTPFDLRDANLVPKAGACTECPFNSAASKMPGLFDNSKAGATCAKPSCFEEKVAASWEKKTAKYLAEGAAVMSLEDGANLFKYGNELQISSRYVEAKAFAPADPSKKSWQQLVDSLPEGSQPQMHIARDTAGKVRELYVADKVIAALAKHGTKWAANKVKSETKAAAKKTAAKKAANPVTPEDKAAAKAKEAERQRREEASERVVKEVLGTAARHYAKNGLTLDAARMVIEHASWQVKEYGEILGEKLDRSWFDKKATVPELLAFAWWWSFNEDYGYGSDHETKEIRALAKTLGLDVEQLLTEQLEGAKAELAKKGKKS